METASNPNARWSCGFLASVAVWALQALTQPAFCQVPVVHWKCSTADSRWADEPDLSVQPKTAHFAGEVISVDPRQRFQTIDGWGGCFNERGWRAMQVLSDAERGQIMRKMFDPADGLKLNICRTPIAASDYAIELYSYDETPGDYEMAHFSIDHDRRLLIPYIKAALALQPAMKVWGVPWSPPSWMKDSKHLAGGKILTDARTMDALALYFAKYVQAYRAEGIPLYMIMPQNEPCYATKYTSCVWTGAELAMFVRDHLGPLFRKMNIHCEIYMGTLPRSDYAAWLAPSLDDPATRSFLTGVGCQWDGDAMMGTARVKHPELKLMQTEASCGDKNTNDWAFAIQRFDEMVSYLNAGAESYMIWNLVLDETGLSTAGWAQCSPIVVNQRTKEVTYTPYFYASEHFSYFVRPGAVRVALKSDHAKGAAFIDADGRVIVVLENATKTAMPVNLQVGDHDYGARLPAESFDTFTLDSEPERR